MLTIDSPRTLAAPIKRATTLAGTNDGKQSLRISSTSPTGRDVSQYRGGNKALMQSRLDVDGGSTMDYSISMHNKRFSFL